MGKGSNPIKKAVDKVGGVRKAAAICGVSTQAVYLWIKAGRLNGLREAFLLADAADMNVKDLGGN